MQPSGRGKLCPLSRDDGRSSKLSNNRYTRNKSTHRHVIQLARIDFCESDTIVVAGKVT